MVEQEPAYASISVESTERTMVENLARKNKVAYEVAFFALYGASGDLELADRFLKVPKLYYERLWRAEEDIELLTKMKHGEQEENSRLYQSIMDKRGIKAVDLRSRFLRQFCSAD